MSGVSGYDELEFERLYARLLQQKTNAFFCVTANSPPDQFEIAEKIRGRFHPGEVQVIDFRNTAPDFRFSCTALHGMVHEGTRILFLTNFQLACGDLSDEEFCQTLNFCRDGLAELPFIFVFVMPLYFRIKIARNAPDFNSFFQYRADFTTADDHFKPEAKTDLSNEGHYSVSNKLLMDYYIGEYSRLQDDGSKQAFEILLKILELNISLRVLHYAELNHFVTELKRLLQKYDSEFVDSAFDIARVFDSQGEYTKALEWYEKALAIKEKVLGKEHPDTAKTYNNIATVYDSQGKYDEALEWHQKALAIKEKVLGKEHPSTAVTYGNIGKVYNCQGDYDKALEWFQKALAIAEKVLGKEHPDTATTYNNIAGIYDSQGDYAQALEWYQKALAIAEKVLGKEHPDTATTYNNIALVYDNQGKYDEALECYQKALDIQEKVLGKEHPHTATTYNNIAIVYDNQGKYDEALECYQKALAIVEKVLGKEHPHTATTYNNIAGVT